MAYAFSRRSLWAVVVAGLLLGGCQGLFSDLDIEFQGEEPVEENQKNQPQENQGTPDCPHGGVWVDVEGRCFTVCENDEGCGDDEHCDQEVGVCVPLPDEECEAICSSDEFCNLETGECEPLEGVVCGSCERHSYCDYDTMTCKTVPNPGTQSCESIATADRCDVTGTPNLGHLVEVQTFTSLDSGLGFNGLLESGSWSVTELFDQRSEALVFEFYGLDAESLQPQNFGLFAHNAYSNSVELTMYMLGLEPGTWLPRSRFGAAEYEPMPTREVRGHGGVIYVPAVLLFGELFQFGAELLYLPLEDVYLEGQLSGENVGISAEMRGVVRTSELFRMLEEAGQLCGCGFDFFVDTTGCSDTGDCNGECELLAEYCDAIVTGANSHADVYAEGAGNRNALAFQFGFDAAAVTGSVTFK